MITQVKNVPLLKVGTYPNRQVDLSLLEKIAGSFNPALPDPTVTDEQGLYGIVVAVNLVGDTLLADLAITSIPAWSVVLPCYAAAEVFFSHQGKDVIMFAGVYLTTEPSFVSQSPLNECEFMVELPRNTENKNIKGTNASNDTFRRGHLKQGQYAGAIQCEDNGDFVITVETRLSGDTLEACMKVNGSTISTIFSEGSHSLKSPITSDDIFQLTALHTQFDECITNILFVEQ